MCARDAEAAIHIAGRIVQVDAASERIRRYAPVARAGQGRYRTWTAADREPPPFGSWPPEVRSVTRGPRDECTERPCDD
jgi:hypothetical protein